MNRRSLSYNWTEEDRLTCAKWRRGMAVFYGCMALIVFGLIVLTKSSSVAVNEARDRPTWVRRFAGNETCSSSPAGE